MYVVGAIANPPKNPRSGEKYGRTIAINIVATTPTKHSFVSDNQCYQYHHIFE